MKRIKIKFVDFWEGFDSNNNFIVDSLKKIYDIEISDAPDYLFYSCFGHDFLKYDCVRIFYTGENVVPDFRMCDYAIGFEYMTYGDRYLRFPLFCVDELYKKDCDLMKEKHRDVSTELCKREFCSMVVSNANYGTTPEREHIFRELCKYKKVNSGGRFLNNIGVKEGVADKLEFQQKHKFALAIENSFSDGYVTEKIVQAYAAKTVPIYCGDFRIKEIFDKESFVDIASFANLSEAIDYIKKIDEDDELYLKMLSVPALKDGEYIEKRKNELDDFLKHIVEQSYEECFRRDRFGRNSLMEEEYKKLFDYRKTSVKRIYHVAIRRIKKAFKKK